MNICSKHWENLEERTRMLTKVLRMFPVRCVIQYFETERNHIKKKNDNVYALYSKYWYATVIKKHLIWRILFHSLSLTHKSDFLWLYSVCSCIFSTILILLSFSLSHTHAHFLFPYVMLIIKREKCLTHTECDLDPG